MCDVLAWCVHKLIESVRGVLRREEGTACVCMLPLHLFLVCMCVHGVRVHGVRACARVCVLYLLSVATIVSLQKRGRIFVSSLHKSLSCSVRGFVLVPERVVHPPGCRRAGRNLGMKRC